MGGFSAGKSVTSMYPGECVIANSGWLARMIFWAVTPQAWNTGNSSSLMSTASPKSGFITSLIPIEAGHPTQIGAPWAWGNLDVISISFVISKALMGFIETTKFPLRFPARVHGILVLNMGTFFFSSAARSRMPASKRAPSTVKEHPIKNATESSGQCCVTSDVSSTSFPCLKILYIGISVLRSAASGPKPLQLWRGEYEPTSRTSINGQACVFLWQNRRKSKASLAFSTTKLHWIYPGQIPFVGPWNVLSRTDVLKVAGDWISCPFSELHVRVFPVGIRPLLLLHISVFDVEMRIVRRDKKLYIYGMKRLWELRTHCSFFANVKEILI